ncbi:hypothetical protein BDL97_12G057500 [Sphagnum fallax]|nr:hypothetical protein BDL97_12G057500 [Sphagnum fallax]
MMDRGREPRRSGGAERGGGGGPVSAPRRPRTSGFKDASVGEDCDETMDDVHNPRLRERPKKDSNSLMMMSSSSAAAAAAGKGLASSTVVSIPRFKRKRQGLHEIHEQVLRGGGSGNSIAAAAAAADEGEDTTHDSEMAGAAASEDDDDLPPPTIPRRPAKSRPQQQQQQQQGKGVEEMSVRNDLPTVPRKARSVPKRAQESPVVETPAAQQQPTPPIASPTPAPSSTLSSSSAVTLKPRRRTKPSGSKPKVPKLLKVSSTPTVSEEVEVAEALFDLARTIPPLPALDRRIDLKPEFKPESKPLPSASVQTMSSPAAQPSNGTAASSLVPPPNTSSTVQTAPSPAAPASPVPSPSLSSAAAPPPAEAPKRKRPRVRTRPEEGVVPAQAGVIAANTVVVNSSIPVAAAAPAAVREVDQIEDHPVGVITEEGSLKTEAATTAAPVSGPGPASSSPSGSLPVAAAPSMRQNSTVERKHEKAEKKIAKGEVTKTTSNEKKPSSAPPLDIKPVPIKLAGPTTTGMQEVDATTVSSPLPVDSPNKKDLAKRSVAQPAPTADDGRVNKFNIDLMALSSKAALPLSSERNDNATGTQGEEVQEKPLVDVSVTAPVVSGWIETAKDEMREQEQQGREETETEKPKEQESDKERERTDMSKLPPQRASKSVKPESRPQKSEKASAAVASSLLASTVALPPSTGMPGWPGVMPSLGYFPAAAGWPAASSTVASSVDEIPQPRVSPLVPPFSNMPPQQPWKRCACHVWIAHFIDRQQQSNRRPFFTAELYGGKSYNPNMSLPPADPLYGSNGGGSPQVGAVAGPSMSSVALGAVLGAGERVSGAKERERERIAAATFVEVLNQNSASQQQPPSLSLQAGTAFGYSATQAGTVAMANSGSSSGVVNGVVAAAATNMRSPALTGSSSGPGTNSLAPVSLGSAMAPGMVASNRVAVSAASVPEQYMHALPFPYHHYPGNHFGPQAFNAPPTHLGSQQAAAQYFAGAPFFAQHLVPPSQQTSAHQTSVASGGGPVPLQKQQQQQQGVRRFPPTGSPHSQQLPPQSPSQSSSLQQMQPQSDKDGRDGPSGGDSGSVAESKFPILHRPPYSQGSPNTSHSNVIVAPASSQTLSSHQDFSMLAALGKHSKQREQQQQQQHVSAQQLQASQPQASLSSQLQQQQQQAHLQISLKGMDPQASQAFSAMTMAAAMNRGPVGPGPLGLAPVAAVMAPQGHAMLQSMADAVRHPPQSPHHSSGSGTPHPSLIQQQQQQQQQQQRIHNHRQQQQQQHRSVQMQRGPLAVDEGHIVAADVSNYPTNTGGGRDRDPGDDRKMSSKQPIGLSSPMSRANLDGSPTRGNTRNVAPALNLSASTSAILSARPTGQIAQSGVPPSVAQASHTARQSVRSKGITGPNTASSAASTTQPNMTSYTERGTLAAATLTAKASGPGLSLAGQTAIPSSQGARQTTIAQHPHLKLSQRTAMGSMPTAPGADPKAVLAAAMAKVQNTQTPLQQQSRSPQVAPRTGSPSQMSSAVSGPPASSPAPLSPLPAGSKPSWSVGAKQGSSTKGSASFPTTQKSAGAASGKRNSSPSLSQHVILGPSPALGNQNLSAKLPQQQQQQQQMVAQNSHPLPQQPQTSQQHAPSLQQQYPQPSQTHKQQNSPQQQQPQPMQMRQHQQMFQQQQMQMFQQQQLPHTESPPLSSAAPQHPQQSQQQPQHASLTQTQLQQNLSHQRPVQHLSQQQQQSPSSLSGSVPNGGLSLASGAMSGSSNSSNIANSSRSSGAENIGGSQATNTRPAPSNFSASPLPSSGSLRGSSPNPAFLHSQFSSQELNSPEQLSSMRLTQVPASVKTSTLLSTASPTSIPQPSSVRPTGAPNQGKSSSGQFTGSNHGDNMVSRNSLMQMVAPSSTVNSSPNHSPNNSISNGNSGSNVQQPPLFAGSSAAVQQGTVNSSQMHPPSSLSMVAASVVPTGPTSTVEP